MELKRHSVVEVEVTELWEPTGNYMFKYVYIYIYRTVSEN